ncbi:MAG: hypothetical protein KJ063_01695 [Anaerolineae bacterium]|nr:hypothetical protein [Anaerolineae bacterium]
MKRLGFLLLLLAVLMPVGLIRAAPPADRIIPPRAVVNEDIVLLNEDLRVENGATINGSIIVTQGDVFIAGTVNGDVVIFNGDLEWGETAQLRGECVITGGKLVNQSTTHAPCKIAPAIPGWGILNQLLGPPTTVPPPQWQWGIGRFVGRVMEAAGWTFTLGVLALVIASVFPRQLHQVSTVVSEKPVVSGTVGLLTGIAGASLMALLSAVFGILILACGLGLLGFPIVIVLSVALAAAALMGWVAIGHKVGVWLAEPLKLKNPSLPTTTVIGTVALSLMVGLLHILGMGFGQWLLMTIVGAVGLGAAALTQFGTRPYPVPTVDAAKVAAAVDNMPE